MLHITMCDWLMDEGLKTSVTLTPAGGLFLDNWCEFMACVNVSVAVCMCMWLCVRGCGCVCMCVRGCVCSCVCLFVQVRVCPVPFLSVLPHTHSSSVARSGVAAGPLADLEANATAGTAGSPQSPGGPHSIPIEKHRPQGYTHNERGGGER